MKNSFFGKTVSILLALIFLLVIIAGCGTTESKSNDQQSAATTAGSQSINSETKGETVSKPVTLRFSWWGGDDRNKATLDAINAYMQKKTECENRGRILNI